jgi:hypothetical protein
MFLTFPFIEQAIALKTPAGGFERYAIFHQLLLDGRYPQLLKGFVLTATSSRLILLAQ